MTELQTGQTWADGDAYDAYVGRWSRLVAPEVIAWLGVSSGSSWVDAGCGTGMVTRALLDAGAASVVGVDRSDGFVAFARRTITDSRARFEVGDAALLPVADGSVDAVISGLLLNFLPDPAAAAAEFRRVVRPGGVVGCYVWDYAEGMELIRAFWDAAISLDAAAIELDEGRRFPLCAPRPLWSLFEEAGLAAVEVRGVEVRDGFASGDEAWRSFLGGQAPAPAYAASLDDAGRERLRAAFLSCIGAAADEPVELTARAFAVRGRRAA